MEKRIDFVDRLARHGVSSTRFSTTFVDIRVGPWRFHADPERRGEPGAVGPRFGIACLGPTAACAGLGALMAAGGTAKLRQKISTSAAVIRATSSREGAFSSRLMVGCEHSARPLSGARPTASLNSGSVRRASQSSAS